MDSNLELKLPELVPYNYAKLRPKREICKRLSVDYKKVKLPRVKNSKGLKIGPFWDEQSKKV